MNESKCYELLGYESNSNNNYNNILINLFN